MSRATPPHGQEDDTTMPIYTVGDATTPKGDEHRIIAHIVNSVGGWGAGFVLAVSAKWPDPERSYRQWYRLRKDHLAGSFTLGNVQFVDVGRNLVVANMVAQVGYGKTGRGLHRQANGGPPPVRYDALEQCLRKVAAEAKNHNGSIHAPRIGCGLGGGSWDEVEPILLRVEDEFQVPITIYDLPTPVIRKV